MMELNGGKTIMIVEDEPRTRTGLHKTLERWAAGRHRVVAVDSASAALKWIDAEPVDLIVTDIRMPEMDGLTLLKEVRERGKQTEAIILSGYPEFDYAQEAIRLGVVNYLVKPVHKQKMIDAVAQALALQENRRRFHSISEHMQDEMIADHGGRALRAPVKEAIRYVERNLGGELSLREVSAHVHLNASYFSFLFKEQTGINFSEFVTRARIEKAKKLLLTTDLTNAEIAEQSGYRTPKYFVRLFRELEGETPGQYRKRKDSGKIR